jgi:hypothetical protein
LDAAFRGDPSLLHDGVEAQIGEHDSLAWGMNTAVQCSEEFALVKPGQVDAVWAQIPPAMQGFALRFPESSPRLVEFCRSLGLPRPDPREDEPVVSDVPVLALNGLYDPFTPPAWGNRSTAGFRTRYEYTITNAGHDSAASSTCTMSMVTAFVADPGRQPDATCLAYQGAPGFTVPFDVQEPDLVPVAITTPSGDIVRTVAPRAFRGGLTRSGSLVNEAGRGMAVTVAGGLTPDEVIERISSPFATYGFTGEERNINGSNWRFVRIGGQQSVLGALVRIGDDTYVVLVIRPEPPANAPDPYRTNILLPALTALEPAPGR